MKNENVYVYIGRFQPAHKGHEAVLENAIKKADRVVILVGSAEQARSPKNPFTFEERQKVLDGITTRLAQDEWAKGRRVMIDILPVHDFVYNNQKWLMEVQEQVRSCTKSENITLTGCRKHGDDSTFYLEFFPQWNQDFITETTQEDVGINATQLRNQFFSTKQVPEQNVLTPETVEFLEKFSVEKKDVLDYLVKEHAFTTKYKADMKKQLPFDTIPFLTGDSLIVCAGHVLVGIRRSEPGKGQYCLPGGFFDAWKDKDQVDTALRELKEETKIDVPMNKLRGSIERVEEFGDFDRDPRWRVITKCIYIKLDGTKLPKVKGSDDLKGCFWMPMTEIAKNRANFFVDHVSIIDTFLGIL
ncbi:nicotinamide-nucleotide adenylyltransferase [Escherichia phage EJP2]|nr:nicotinamide-nucleotide adenylyltransferase [Escherichia phage EJP2]